MELSASEFQSFQVLIRDLCGIALGEGKEYLVKQRLEPIVTAQGLGNFTALYDRLRRAGNSPLEEEVIAALTTNETSFFRDRHPFETFKAKLMPELARIAFERKAAASQRKGPKVTLWCAAASTGQEPYTLAMLVHEYATAHAREGISPDDFNIISTDISTHVLARAIEGAYTELEMKRGLPAIYRDRYFDNTGQRWVVREEIRKLVEFRRLNLMHSLNHFPGVDAIFCRNVLIYFDNDMKRRLLQEFHRLLIPGGPLLLGASENIYGLTDQFESARYQETIVYRKRAAQPVARTGELVTFGGAVKS